MRNWRLWIVLVVIVLGMGAVLPAAAQANDFNTLMDQAISLYFEGDYSGAVSIINQALDANLDPSSEGFALDWRGWIRYMQGDFAKARADLERAVDVYPDDPIFYIDLAMMNVMTGNHADALENYQTAIDMNPEYHFYADQVVTDLTSIEFLIRNYTVAIDTNPTDYAAITFRGAQYANIGMWEDAIADFQRALELQPNFEPAEQALADVLDVSANPGRRVTYCPIPDVDVVPRLELNTTIEGTIDLSFFFTLYCLDLPANTTLTVTMEATSGDLEPAFTIFDAGTNMIFSSEDQASGDSISLSWTFEDGGYYILLATRVGADVGDTEGDYTLTVSTGGGTTVDCNDPNADESKCGK